MMTMSYYYNDGFTISLSRMCVVRLEECNDLAYIL